MLFYLLMFNLFLNLRFSTNSSNSIAMEIRFVVSMHLIQHITFILRPTQKKKKNQLLQSLIFRSRHLPRTTAFGFDPAGRDLSPWLTMRFEESSGRNVTAAVASWNFSSLLRDTLIRQLRHNYLNKWHYRKLLSFSC